MAALPASERQSETFGQKRKMENGVWKTVHRRIANLSERWDSRQPDHRRSHQLPDMRSVR
jgi:hypothetical protein